MIFHEIKKSGGAHEYQADSDVLCLGQCDTEKIVSRINADKLDDESFDAVEEHVEEEEGARDVQAFAYGP